MLYLATISFSGVISMAKGRVGEISDPALADDLLKAGYIVPYEATDKKRSEPKPEPAEEKKPKSKKREKGE